MTVHGREVGFPDPNKPCSSEGNRGPYNRAEECELENTDYRGSLGLTARILMAVLEFSGQKRGWGKLTDGQ